MKEIVYYLIDNDFEIWSSLESQKNAFLLHVHVVKMEIVLKILEEKIKMFEKLYLIVQKQKNDLIEAIKIKVKKREYFLQQTIEELRKKKES